MHHSVVATQWVFLSEHPIQDHLRGGDIVTDYRSGPLGISIIDRFYAANPAYYMQPFRIL